MGYMMAEILGGSAAIVVALAVAVIFLVRHFRGRRLIGDKVQNRLPVSPESISQTAQNAPEPCVPQKRVSAHARFPVLQSVEGSGFRG